MTWGGWLLLWVVASVPASLLVGHLMAWAGGEGEADMPEDVAGMASPVMGIPFGEDRQ
jgi:hypothetical protein